MKVLIFGATGMVGQGVLLECLRDPEVELVAALGRTATGVRDSKLRDIVHRDLLNYSGMESKSSRLRCVFLLSRRRFDGNEGSRLRARDVRVCHGRGRVVEPHESEDDFHLCFGIGHG